MPVRRCPDCARRLPYAGRRCVHCGWTAREGGAGRGTAHRLRVRAATALVVVLGLLAAGTAYRHAALIADWYAGFAAHHLPPAASSFAPAGTSTGAFFFCARQVARRMGEFSVETFPSEEASRVAEIGADRYRIESSVEASRPDGGSVRVPFVCTTHFERGRWVLEELEMKGEE